MRGVYTREACFGNIQVRQGKVSYGPGNIPDKRLIGRMKKTLDADSWADHGLLGTDRLVVSRPDRSFHEKAGASQDDFGFS